MLGARSQSPAAGGVAPEEGRGSCRIGPIRWEGGVGSRGKGLVAGGQRGGCCEQGLGAAPWLGRAPLFRGAEPLSDVVLRLCESRFKTGKKPLRHTAAARVRGARKSLAGAKGSEEGGGEVLQAWSRSPLRPVVRPVVKQAVPLQPME